LPGQQTVAEEIHRIDETVTECGIGDVQQMSRIVRVTPRCRFREIGMRKLAERE